jgi:hypothetical protein
MFLFSRGGFCSEYVALMGFIVSAQRRKMKKKCSEGREILCSRCIYMHFFHSFSMNMLLCVLEKQPYRKKEYNNNFA